MELNEKCKCGGLWWIDIYFPNFVPTKIIRCTECNKPYPDPDPIIREALEFIDDVIKNDLLRHKGTSTAWKYASATMQEILKTFKELKQILEKWGEK